MPTCFGRTALYFVVLKGPPICVVRTTVYFVVWKNWAVLLKWKGGLTKMNSQNMLYNLDHPICLHSVCVFVSSTHIWNAWTIIFFQIKEKDTDTRKLACIDIAFFKGSLLTQQVILQPKLSWPKLVKCVSSNRLSEQGRVC